MKGWSAELDREISHIEDLFLLSRYGEALYYGDRFLLRLKAEFGSNLLIPKIGDRNSLLPDMEEVRQAPDSTEEANRRLLKLSIRIVVVMIQCLYSLGRAMDVFPFVAQLYGDQYQLYDFSVLLVLIHLKIHEKDLKCAKKMCAAAFGIAHRVLASSDVLASSRDPQVLEVDPADYAELVELTLFHVLSPLGDFEGARALLDLSILDESSKREIGERLKHSTLKSDQRDGYTKNTIFEVNRLSLMGKVFLLCHSIKARCRSLTTSRWVASLVITLVLLMVGIWRRRWRLQIKSALRRFRRPSNSKFYNG